MIVVSYGDAQRTFIQSQAKSLIPVITFITKTRRLKEGTMETNLIFFYKLTDLNNLFLRKHFLLPKVLLKNVLLLSVKPKVQDRSNTEQTQTVILAIPFFNHLFQLKKSPQKFQQFHLNQIFLKTHQRGYNIRKIYDHSLYIKIVFKKISCFF